MLKFKLSQIPSPDKGHVLIGKMKFWGEGRGGCKGVMEKSRYDWVFLNVGLPKLFFKS